MSRPPLLELPGKVEGEPVKVCVLESLQSDPVRLYEQILDGRYARPFIIDDGETRQLLFNLDFIQSSMRIDDPFALDIAYTRKMMAFLLFAPNPDHVLMVGLGGGSLAKFCHRHLPRARLTVVEVNPTSSHCARRSAYPTMNAWRSSRPMPPRTCPWLKAIPMCCCWMASMPEASPRRFSAALSIGRYGTGSVQAACLSPTSPGPGNTGPGTWPC